MKRILYILILFLLVFPINFVNAEVMAEKLSGRILLQVEESGEAWYVNPKDLKRYFLGRPDDAFFIMRELGIGITNNDLSRIPMAVKNLSGQDSDSDGLPDAIENAIGTDPEKKDTDNDGYADKNELNNYYNPNGDGDLPIDLNFTNKNLGKIFLQVENHGEAWYVNPSDKKRYFLGRAEDAFNIMRSFGLGITNENLEKIVISEASPLPVIEVSETSDRCEEAIRASSDLRFNLTEMEKEIYDLINKEREKNGLGELKWNCKIAESARNHSDNLAQENNDLTDYLKTCDYPTIHHEGIVSGLYHVDRLNEIGVYYFNKAGENIALVPGVGSRIFSGLSEEESRLLEDCETNRNDLYSELQNNLEAVKEEEKVKIIKEDIEKRKQKIVEEKNIEPDSINWQTQSEVNQEIVDGWMNSPGHRKNILTGDYDETGIGISYINGYIIATQVFITRAECGYKGGQCCVKEGYYPSCFSDLVCENSICK